MWKAEPLTSQFQSPMCDVRPGGRRRKAQLAPGYDMHDNGSVFSDLTSNVEKEEESPLRNAKSFLSRHSADSADASSDMSVSSDLAMLDSGSVNYFDTDNTSSSGVSARVGGVASKSPFTHFTKLHALIPLVKK
jgi:hypothetical protein